jgi:hypothetical protein
MNNLPELPEEEVREIDLEFDTYAEKMAFLKGMTFETEEKLAVIAYGGHFDETRNKAGKYEWSLSVCPI